MGESTGSVQIGEETITCSGVHGEQTLEEAFAHSCNVCSPCTPEQVTVSSPIWTLPVQVHVRLMASGSCSSAAVSVTVLNTEPGTMAENQTDIHAP